MLAYSILIKKSIRSLKLSSSKQGHFGKEDKKKESGERASSVVGAPCACVFWSDRSTQTRP